MNLFSTRMDRLENLAAGSVLHSRQDDVLKMVLAVCAPGVYILSDDNDYRRTDGGSYTAYELFKDTDAILVDGDRLAKLEEKKSVRKD